MARDHIRIVPIDNEEFFKAVLDAAELDEDGITNPTHAVMRKGEIVVDKPSLVLPSASPQFEGFDFDKELHINEGMLTFHPQGIHHGPQKGAIEKSKTLSKTDEVAVMIDTRNPLNKGENTQTTEIQNYWSSWR